MHPFPHHYHVTASGGPDGEVDLRSPGLPELATTAPPEFDGPEGYWAPETLLLGAVTDCFILSFRSVARASRLDWESLECSADGTLDREDRVTRFTHITVKPRLTVPAQADRDAALRCLEKAEHVCLITNSMNSEVVLEPVVEVSGEAVASRG